MRVAVEVCVASFAEAAAAAAAGADTVEVCAWLACGGITPSSGLVDAVRGPLPIQARILVRPSPGGFVYTPAELHALVTDAEVFGGGALGLVTGALTATGSVDESVIRAVIHAAPESEITFHRAIDHAADMLRSLDNCIELGLHRILTSGGETLALDGAARLKAMVERAGDRLMIAAAGGINPKNVVELVERTGAREVHFAAQKPKASASRGASMSSSHVGVSFETEPDAAKIEGVMNALVKAGLR
jgi:copper homeostasis protein